VKDLTKACSWALPTAHACICTIDLPAYPSYEILLDRLRIALLHGSRGFDEGPAAEGN
jgi:hypothetical protein